MPGKTTASSAETVTVSKTSLEGVPEWEAEPTSQDSPSNWGRERVDSMRSGSSKSGENGSVMSATSTPDVGGNSAADPNATGPVETAKEAKEHMMKRTSSWMKNLGNGMRTLRLRKSGSGVKKNKEKLDNSILDDDGSSSVKADGEIPEESAPMSGPPSPSVTSETSSTSKPKKIKPEKKEKEKKEKKKKSSEVTTEAAADVPVTVVVVEGTQPVPLPVPAPEPKHAPVPLLHVSKWRKRRNSASSGQNGTAAAPKPSNENPDKTDPARFIGEGLCFKAKLIGVLEVSGPRGDRICQEALSELKMAVKAAGEHKQKVTIHVALDGLRLRDEKTGDCLYHHQVHKISFIAQDLTDTRAFGYIFGSPDTGHRFFGIKTEKSASQVVMAMRDLFQVVFDLKKKEIERAKQQLELQQKFLATRAQETAPRSKSDMMDGACALATSSAPAEADLLNLEVELSSLQEGLENIHSNLADSNAQHSMFNRGSTASISSDPMNPMSPGFKYSTMSNNVNHASPAINSHSSKPPVLSTTHSGMRNMNSFGDSFDPFDSNPPSAKLWPSPFTNDPFSQVDPFAQVDPFPKPRFSSFDSGGDFFTSDPFDTSGGAASLTFTETNTNSNTAISRQNSQKKTELVNDIQRKDSTGASTNKMQDLSNATTTNGPTTATAAPTTGWMASFEDNFVPQSDGTNGSAHASGRTSTGLDIFTELDPLGTGRVRPFVDRKDFFNDLKNPPKKVLKDLSQPSSEQSLLSSTAVAGSQQKVLQQHPQLQEPTIQNSFSTHFNPPSNTCSTAGASGLDFESHFKLPTKTELRTSSIRVRLPSSSGGDSPPNYSPPPPPPIATSSSSVSNSVYFINPPVTNLTPPVGGGSRAKKSQGLLKNMTISNTPAPISAFNTSPKTLPRSTRLGKNFSIPDCTEEIPSLTPPPPPRPPPSSSSTLTRNSTSAVPRPHSGSENRRQNYATLGSISHPNAPPEPPPRPLQTTIISDISSFAPPLVSPPPPLPPKKQVIGPTLSSSILGKLLYTGENLSSAEKSDNELPLPLPSRRNGNTNSMSNSSSSNQPRYALPAENSTSSPILYNRKRMQPIPEPPPINPPELSSSGSGQQVSMEQALNQVASMSLGQLAGKLGLPVTQLSYLTIHQLAEQLTMLDMRRNSDVGPTTETGFASSFESNFEPENDNEQNDISTVSAPATCDASRPKQPPTTTTNSNSFDKYAVFRELTLEDASGFSIEEDVGGGSRTLTSMTSRDSSSERTLQADDGPEEEDAEDTDHPMLATMDDITDVNFSDGGEEENEKSVLDDEVVDLNTKSEWATFESNFDEQFVPLSKSEESPWESDVEGDGDGNAVIKPPQKVESTPKVDQFDFVPFEKPAPIELKRRDSHPLKSLEEPKFQRQSSSSSKHSDRSTGTGATPRSYQGHGKPRTASDCSADSGKDRPYSGSGSGRRHSRGGRESDEEWAPPSSHSAAARKIRSHRHYPEDEPVLKPRTREIEDDEGNEDDDDRSHASFHSTSNSYSRERRHRRHYPSSSKYYDARHGGSQSLQRHGGRYKGRGSGRPGSPYSNQESDFEDSFEDEGVSTMSGRKRDYMREDYWSAGSRPSSSGSGRRYPPGVSHRERDRPDYHSKSYHPRERDRPDYYSKGYHPRERYSHSSYSRHHRDRDRERERGRHGERKDEDEIEENVSDFSEDSGRWVGPGKKGRSKRPPHPHSHSHRSDRDRDSKRHYYNSNSPSWDSESPPPDPDAPPGKKTGRRYGGNGRPSSASHCHYNDSFVNTPPTDERVSSAKSSGSRQRDSQGKGGSKYQSDLALNSSRKLSASEFRFDDADIKVNENQGPEDSLTLPDPGAGSGASLRLSDTNSNASSKIHRQRPPESPFEDNFVPAGNDSTKASSTVPENDPKSPGKEEVFFPAKFDFDPNAVEQMKGDEESLDNSLDISEKSVESLQETPPSTERKSVESEIIERETKKSNSYNIFVRDTDPFEDDDFFK